MSAVKIRTLLWWSCGQDEQESGNDQLYTGSGDDDAVQFSITYLLTFTINVSFCVDNNWGGPVKMIGIFCL